MTNLRLITITLLFLISSKIFSQNISSSEFNEDLINEDFNKRSKVFKTVTDSENYFIVDNGDYFLSRHNNDTEYAIFANNSNVSDFIIRTAIRIGPSKNNDASLGLILKAQKDAEGAIIFEINKKGQYRIKQLNRDRYQILSSNKNNGWIKENSIKGVDEINNVEIRSEKNIYDVYINNNFITTFFIPDFTSGSCGIIISPQTKARLSYFNIIVKDKNQDSISVSNLQGLNAEKTIEKLSKRIQNIEEKYDKLNSMYTVQETLHQEELSKLKHLKDSLINVNNEYVKSIKKQEDKINKLDDIAVLLDKKIKENEKLENELDFIENKNEKLKEKNSTLINKNTNLIEEKTKLSDKIKNKENKISILDKANKQLEEKIKSEKEKNSTLTNKNTNLTLEKKQLSDKIKNKENKLSVLGKTKNQLEDKIKLEKENYNKTIIELNSKLKLLENEKSATNNLYDNSLKINNKLDSENAKIKKINKENNDLIANLKSSISNLEQQVNKEKSNSEKLKNSLSKSNEEKNYLKSKNTELTNKISQQEKSQAKNIKSYTLKIDKLEKNLKESEQKNKDLTSKNQTYDRMLLDLKHESREIKRKLNESTSKNSSLEILYGKQSSTIDSLKAHNDKIQIELDTAKNKISLLSNNNTKLKDLFVKKDFEKNNINPNNVSLNKIETKSNQKNELKKTRISNEIYTIQLGVFMQKQPNSVLENLIDTWYTKNTNDLYIYYSGEFKSTIDATNHLNYIKSKGFDNAIITTLKK